MFLIGAVTREAIIRKNGSHLPVEIDGWCSRGKCEWNSGEKSNEEMSSTRITTEPVPALSLRLRERWPFDVVLKVYRNPK